MYLVHKSHGHFEFKLQSCMEGVCESDKTVIIVKVTYTSKQHNIIGIHHVHGEYVITTPDLYCSTEVTKLLDVIIFGWVKES